MNNRKAHNSILFLTTLSVYLGLALVGGSPSVFAQAALTPRFELVTEFETEDDLDNKPDDEQIVGNYAAVCGEFLRLAKQFTEANREKLSDHRYSFDYSVINDPTRTKQGGFSRSLAAPGGTLPNNAEIDKERHGVTLEFSDVGFSLRSAFNQVPSVQTDNLAAFYNNLVSSRITDSEPRVIIYRNTTVTRENNRIVVVTRLPRASIDEPLADKVAN
ncbi:MAG: hypothetical protein IPK58_16175 [Acidobacteria bacterium]|nr:hypothetical protein [Acidobacteriota bacterium]